MKFKGWKVASSWQSKGSIWPLHSYCGPSPTEIDIRANETAFLLLPFRPFVHLPTRRADIRSGFQKGRKGVYKPGSATCTLHVSGRVHAARCSGASLCALQRLRRQVHCCAEATRMDPPCHTDAENAPQPPHPAHRWIWVVLFPREGHHHYPALLEVQAREMHHCRKGCLYAYTQNSRSGCRMFVGKTDYLDL